MKLKDCTYGRLVIETEGGMIGLKRVGMIVGITNNRPSASVVDKGGVDIAIPLVQWSCCGTRSGIHPSNIELLK